MAISIHVFWFFHSPWICWMLKNEEESSYEMRTALFCVTMHRIVIISYRRFETTLSVPSFTTINCVLNQEERISHLLGGRSLKSRIVLLQNLSKYIPVYTVSHPKNLKLQSLCYLVQDCCVQATHVCVKGIL